MAWLCVLRGMIFSGVAFCALTTFSQEKIVFEKKTIHVGSHKLLVEVADTPQKTSRGLMYRLKKLKDSEGMLFVFRREELRNFWMKNTFIPLSIGFFDSQKKLVSFMKMKPVRSEMEKPESYSSKEPAQYALEVAPGWFERKKVRLGAKLKF